MMRSETIRKSATATLCSGVLVGFLFAAGCSQRPTSGNKLDDPELKAYMKKTTEQYKTKMLEKKANNPKASEGFGHP